MKGNNVRNYRDAYYFEGSAARNLEVIPNYPDEVTPSRREQPKRKEHKRRKADTGMDIFSFLFFTVAVSLTLYTCIEYLNVQSNITQMEKKAASLESELIKLENENKAALSQINTSLDLNYIYKIAINELGMVYPDKNQVITYESNLSDYVRQYKEIPEERETTLLQNIME